MMKSVDLVSGNIFRSLFKLAIPILGTSFIQMAYNMTDMMWVGRIGSGAVAAVGTASFLLFLEFYFEIFFYRTPITTFK